MEIFNNLGLSKTVLKSLEKLLILDEENHTKCLAVSLYKLSGSHNTDKIEDVLSRYKILIESILSLLGNPNDMMWYDVRTEAYMKLKYLQTRINQSFIIIKLLYNGSAKDLMPELNVVLIRMRYYDLNVIKFDYFKAEQIRSVAQDDLSAIELASKKYKQEELVFLCKYLAERYTALLNEINFKYPKKLNF